MLTALLTVPILGMPAPQAESLPITVNVGTQRTEVLAGGELFTALNHGSEGNPYLYPLLGPGQAPLTRGYPMDPQPGETKDHPHHRSAWIAHGSVNGYDFWHSTAAGERIALDEILGSGSGEEGWIRARYYWMAGGVKLLEEEREYRFEANDRQRRVDVQTTFKALAVPVRFGDTKEGFFGVRLAPSLRLSGPRAEGRARNSKGDRGREVWGKRANWVAYTGPVEVEGASRKYTVALFDHPQNLRYPTWWHARDYGLVAANPFGIHDFQGDPAGTGDHTLQPGQTLELRYRIQLRGGASEDAALDLEGLSFRSQGGGAPPIPKSYELRIDEDFSGSEFMERFTFSDAKVWMREDLEEGSLALLGSSEYAPPYRSPRSIALLQQPLFGSFVMEAEVQQTGREYGHRDLCLFFAFGAPDRFYYTHLATTPDAHAHNIFLVAGSPREALAPVPARGVDWGQETWHTVRVTRDLTDGLIRVEFDGQKVLETRDRTHAYGRVGFGSFDDTGRIRRLRVWAEEIRLAPEGADPFQR